MQNVVQKNYYLTIIMSVYKDICVSIIKCHIDYTQLLYVNVSSLLIYHQYFQLVHQLLQLQQSVVEVQV